MLAQTPSPATTPASPVAAAATAPDPVMPKDPNALMQLAARVNGIGSPDMKPWHIKAAYQTFDADGKPKDQGVFEEWWAAPEKYKISYTSSKFNQVQYRIGDNSWTSGDAGWAPPRDDMVEQYLIHPLQMPAAIDKRSYVMAKRQLGNVTLVCARHDDSKSEPPGPDVICFDDQKPVLRLEESEGEFVLFNDVVRMDNHYVDRQIIVEALSHPIVKADVTTLEFPNAFDDSVFAVPASAKQDERAAVQGIVMAGKKIGGENIPYPMVAKSQRIQGTVTLAAIISKSGHIADLEVISGPKELRKSSIDAIKTWKYTPYLLNGHPVEVRTEIHVEYSLQ